MHSQVEDYNILADYAARVRAEGSLYEFVKQAWGSVEGMTPYADNWHVQVICEHLQALTERKINRLIINIPPRCMKSTLLSVMWPAWAWLKMPGEQFLYASNATSLSHRDSRKCRRLIASPFYQARWSERYQLQGDHNTLSRFENTQKGYRLSSSVNSSIVGEGGSCLVLDDPNSPDEVESDTVRESVNDWYSQVWSTRLNNLNTGVMALVQQRLHEKDVTGYVLGIEEKQWTHLCLPMNFEASNRCKTIILPSTDNKVWADPREKEGDLLWPSHMPEEKVESLKRSLNSPYKISGQLQQRPSPELGGMIKASWFPWWKEAKVPKLIRIIGSLDTAFDIKDTNAYSALTTWGYFNQTDGTPSLILLNLWRGKLEYPDLRDFCKAVYDDYRDDGVKPVEKSKNYEMDMLLIEAKANGLSLMQDLRRGGINAMGFDPTREGDKLARVSLASSYMRDGLIFLPAMPPNFKILRPMSEEFLHQCKMFPAGESRDLIDTVSMIILYMKNNGALFHKKDPKFLSSIKRPEGVTYGVDSV